MDPKNLQKNINVYAEKLKESDFLFKEEPMENNHPNTYVDLNNKNNDKKEKK